LISIKRNNIDKFVLINSGLLSYVVIVVVGVGVGGGGAAAGAGLTGR